jgi:hypothetical protein
MDRWPSQISLTNGWWDYLKDNNGVGDGAVVIGNAKAVHCPGVPGLTGLSALPSFG